MRLPEQVIQNLAKNDLVRFFVATQGDIAGYIFRVRTIVFAESTLNDPVFATPYREKFIYGDNVQVLECLVRVKIDFTFGYSRWRDLDWIMYHQNDPKYLRKLEGDGNALATQEWLGQVIGPNFEIQGTDLGKWTWGQKSDFKNHFKEIMHNAQEPWTVMLDVQFVSLMAFFLTRQMSSTESQAVQALFKITPDIDDFIKRFRPRRSWVSKHNLSSLERELSSVGNLSKDLFDLWILDLMVWWHKEIQGAGLNLCIAPVSGQLRIAESIDLSVATREVQRDPSGFAKVSLVNTEQEIFDLLVGFMPKDGIKVSSSLLRKKLYRGPLLLKSYWVIELQNRTTLEYFVDSLGIFSHVEEFLRGQGFGIALTPIGKRAIWLPSRMSSVPTESSTI